VFHSATVTRAQHNTINTCDVTAANQNWCDQGATQPECHRLTRPQADHLRHHDDVQVCRYMPCTVHTHTCAIALRSSQQAVAAAHTVKTALYQRCVWPGYFPSVHSPKTVLLGGTSKHRYCKSACHTSGLQAGRRS
jgi:hypothetical protein